MTSPRPNLHVFQESELNLHPGIKIFKEIKQICINIKTTFILFSFSKTCKTEIIISFRHLSVVLPNRDQRQSYESAHAVKAYRLQYVRKTFFHTHVLYTKRNLSERCVTRSFKPRRRVPIAINVFEEKPAFLDSRQDWKKNSGNPTMYASYFNGCE